MDYRNILNKIKEIRKKKGISSDKLGEMVGLSGPAIRLIENGKRRLSLELLEKIAKALDVSIYELIDEEPKPLPEETEEVLIKKLIFKKLNNKNLKEKPEIYRIAERRLKRALEDIDDLLKIV